MRIGLSNLRKHKFKHSFQETLNPMWNSGEDTEISSHSILPCPNYLQENMTLSNTVTCIVPNIFGFNNDKLTEILFYGKKNLDYGDIMYDKAYNNSFHQNLEKI